MRLTARGGAYCGWAGRLLRVDLTAMQCAVEPIDPYLEFLGGRKLPGVEALTNK